MTTRNSPHNAERVLPGCARTAARRSSVGHYLVEAASATEPTSGATSTPPPFASPLPAGHGHPGEAGAAEGVRPSTGQPAGDPAPALFTPAQAAELLQVRESWLRRRAARRQVPCTFLGKHLRFSHANVEQILADAARPAATVQRTALGTGASPRRRGRPRSRARTDSRRPDVTRTHSSGN
jgi:hypothetical protein